MHCAGGFSYAVLKILGEPPAAGMTDDSSVEAARFSLEERNADLLNDPAPRREIDRPSCRYYVFTKVPPANPGLSFIAVCDCEIILANFVINTIS